MRFLGIFTLSALAQYVLAANFRVIAPGGKDVQVSVNGQNVKLTAQDPDVPYFTGNVNAGANTKYKYVVNGKTETFDRTLTSESTKNDFYERNVTYADIPAFPTVIGENDWTHAIQAGPIWDINYIPSVFITMDKKNENALVKDLSKDIFDAKITYIDAEETHTFQGARFQLHKPGKKHNNAKQSWKWELPKGQKLNGRDFFKIRHMEEDPTQIREKLYADILRAMGVHAPQANMIRFFINGRFYGTFNMLDDIPEYSYIQAIFYAGQTPNPKGPLFDGASGASFENKEDTLYAFITARGSSDDKSMISKVDKALDELRSKIKNDAAVAEFSKIFNVDQFLRYMVMEFLANHWDGYWQEQTNIGAYADTANGKLYFLGQDFDGTFGINSPYDTDFLKVPYTEYPKRFPKAVMINTLLQNGNIKATFEKYLKLTVTKLFNDKVLVDRVLRYHNFVLPDLEADRKVVQLSKGINFEWSVDQVTTNLYEGVEGHNPKARGGAQMGLIEYIKAKYQAVKGQLGTSSDANTDTPTGTPTDTPTDNKPEDQTEAPVDDTTEGQAEEETQQ